MQEERPATRARGAAFAQDVRGRDPRGDARGHGRWAAAAAVFALARLDRRGPPNRDILGAVRGGRVRVAIAGVIALAIGQTGCDRVYGLDRGRADAAPDPTGDGADSGIALVQKVADSLPSGTMFHGTFKNPPTSGNLLIMIGAAETDALKRPTGGGVGTWMVAAQSNQHQNVEIWWGVTDGSSSTVTIACGTRCAQTLGPMWLELTEWSGLATAAPVDDHNAADGTAIMTPPGVASPGTITTISGPDLLILGVTDDRSIDTQVMDVEPWMPLDPIMADPVTQRAWYRIAQTPGSYTPRVTVTADWDAAAAAFLAAP
jgi:hypothetical protein